MALEESIEFFPLFDPNTKTDPPAISVAVGDHVAVVGSPDAMEGCGAVTFYAFSEETKTWGYVGVMLGSHMQGSREVRRLGMSCLVVGDTVLVGAPGDEQSPGAVMILKPPYGTWTYGCVPEITALTRSESGRGDQFGTSIGYCAVGADDYVIVGAPEADPPRGPFGKGMVFVYKGLESATDPWSTSPAANPDEEGTEEQRFGAAVAITPGVDAAGSPDGTLVLAVGAPGAKNGQGVVYVGQTTEAGAWPNRFRFDEALEPKFPDFVPEEFTTTDFGTSVALSGGTVLAVGAPSDPNFEKQIEGTGAVWLYHRAEGRFELKEEGGSMFGDDADARFGASLAFPPTRMVEDPDAPPPWRVLVVGAPGLRSAVRYESEDGRDFTLGEQFASYGGKKGDGYGSAVAIADHGDSVWSVVAAPGNPTAEIDGGAYLYVEGDEGMKWADSPALLEYPRVRWFGSNADAFKKYTPRIERYL